MASKDKYNLVSGELPEDLVADMRSKFSEWRGKMPFLVALTTNERQSLTKPSADQLDACATLAAAADSHPAYFPSDMVDTAELRRDLALADAMEEIATDALAFGEALMDTVRAAQSDSYRTGLVAYGLGKLAEPKIPGFGEKLDKMRVTLLRKSRKQPSTET